MLSDAVLAWQKLKKGTEDDLTKSLTKKIEAMSGTLSYHAHSEVHLRDYDANRVNPPRIDILLSPAEDKKKNIEPTTPYAVIEFGLHGMDWSKKLDQNVKCLDRMVTGNLATDTLEFQQPILCGVVTIEAEEGEPFAFKIGVFLCSRRDLRDPDDVFRMSLLWHAQTGDLDEASRLFGNILRGTRDFQFWVSEKGCLETTNKYEYLSTSCCRCTLAEDGSEVVLRSYDNRVRTSNRNPEIYLDADCQQEAGVGKTLEVVTLVTSENREDPKDLDKEISSKDLNTLETTMWKQGGRRSLQIISTPYRKGYHVPNSPAAFIPVILQLQKLQQLDYVHGDIRAFNTVFGIDSSEGWLIDFDFGGKEGQTRFPKGYKTMLEDARRIGKELNPIEKFHDWHSLGRMIFEVFDYNKSAMDDATKELFSSNSEVWTRLRKPPSDEQISELVGLLDKIKDVSLEPDPSFQQFLEEITEQQTGNNGAVKTMAAATGTPKLKNR